MISAFKIEFKRIAELNGAAFVNMSIDELQEFAQSYDFAMPLVRLQPIENIQCNIIDSGAIRYNLNCELYFLTKFNSDDNSEELKDLLIDKMIYLSEQFISRLNKNEMLYFINPRWSFNLRTIRQYTSNLLCGCSLSIAIDTACNRIAIQSALDINLNSPIN